METKKFVIRCRAIIFLEGKLLLVKHPHDTSFAALPGGHLEWGEDIRECLRREIVEEMGVEPEIGRLLYINNFMDGTKAQAIEFFFEIINSNDFKNIENSNTIDKKEIAEIFWTSPTDEIHILPEGLEKYFKTNQLLSNEVRYIN